jgi:hypothetical protein
MDIAMNVVLLVAAMVAAAAGIGAVLALKMTQRSRNARLQAAGPRGRHAHVDARESRHGHASGPSTRPPRPSRSTSSEGFEVKARIKALRASLHRDHDKPAAKEAPPPMFADTEVFEDGDEMPTMVMPARPALATATAQVPAQAPAPGASPMASAPKTPNFELLRLDFGTAPGQKPPVDDHSRRGAAR